MLYSWIFIKQHWISYIIEFITNALDSKLVCYISKKKNKTKQNKTKQNKTKNKTKHTHARKNKNKCEVALIKLSSTILFPT